MELFTHTTGVRVLALDDQPELVVSTPIVGKELAEIEQLTGPVQQVWSSPSGQLRSYTGNLVMSVSNDQSIEVWMPVE